MQGKKVFAIASSLTVLGLFAFSCAPAVAPTVAPKPATPSSLETPRVKPAATAPTPSPKPAAAESPRYGGTLNISAHDTFRHYDLHQNSTALGLIPFQHAYNNLVQYHPLEPGKIIGDLAQSWDVSPEGTVYTFRLHKGVKWHDGKPFTSMDAQYSLQRMYSPPKGTIVPKVGELMGAIKNAEAPNPETVKVTLKYVSASFLPALATAWSANLPRHIIEEKGDMKRTIMGTGPFKFSVDIPDNSLALVKNKEYFKEGLPYLDAIRYYIIKDPATRFAAFRTKRVQMTFTAYGFTPSQLELAKREVPGMKIGQDEGTNFTAYFLLTTKPPWNDVRVRKAISLAIDRQEAVRTLEEDIGVVSGPMPPGPWRLAQDEISKLPGYRQPKAVDRAEAKRLLAEAGYGEGLKFTMLYQAGRTYESAAEFFKDQMTKIGLEVTIVPRDVITFQNLLQQRDFDTAHNKRAITIYDPDDILQYYRSNASLNAGAFGDPEIDRLFDEQSKILDEAKRREVVLTLQRLIIEKVPWVLSHWGNYVTGWWPEVRNFTRHPGPYTYWRMENVWLAR